MAPIPIAIDCLRPEKNIVNGAMPTNSEIETKLCSDSLTYKNIIGRIDAMAEAARKN